MHAKAIISKWCTLVNVAEWMKGKETQHNTRARRAEGRIEKRVSSKFGENVESLQEANWKNRICLVHKRLFREIDISWVYRGDLIEGAFRFSET